MKSRTDLSPWLGCLPVLALFTVLGGALLFNVAFAQAPDAPAFDIGAWFVDTAALAAIIVTVVAYIREHVLKNLAGAAVIALSLGVGAGFGLAGHAFGFLDGGLVPSLVFGLSAGLAASGGWDAVSGLLGKREAPRELEA